MKTHKKRIFIIVIFLALLSTLRIAIAEITPLSFRLNSSLYGKASWYSRHSPGINKYTANNERFNDQEMTCAIWGIEFDRQVRVTNLENGKSVVVRVNDRGPDHRLLLQGRMIDLTKSAFRKIAPTRQGIVDVKIELL